LLAPTHTQARRRRSRPRPALPRCHLQHRVRAEPHQPHLRQRCGRVGGNRPNHDQGVPPRDLQRVLAPPVHDDVGNRFGGGCVEEDRGLPVRECEGRVYVEGLTEREVHKADEALDILRVGMDGRRVAATNMNRILLRSHAVFSLTIKSEFSSSDGIDKVRTTKFTLVDLAGSERQKSTAADGERLKEASMINASLLCLGQVINALEDRSSLSGGEGGGGHKHVPFRDSKLTFLHRDSWGGGGTKT
ncbi:hypothetical protein ACHAWF_000262, partial [Thalassiosira exigua]